MITAMMTSYASASLAGLKIGYIMEEDPGVLKEVKYMIEEEKFLEKIHISRAVEMRNQISRCSCMICQKKVRVYDELIRRL